MTDVLCFDLSKSGTGWARYRSGDPRPSYGSYRLGGAYSDRADCMVELYKKLQEATAFGDPDLVMYESPLRGDHQSSEANNRLLNALAAMIEFYFKCRRVPCREVNNRTWKAVQLTNKRMTTAEAKALSMRMSRDFGMTPQNDNESDALHILDYALGMEGIVPPWRVDPPLPIPPLSA